MMCDGNGNCAKLCICQSIPHAINAEKQELKPFATLAFISVMVHFPLKYFHF